MFYYLYVHIPFCQKICFYCDFFRVKKPRDEMINEFLLSLDKEVKKNKAKLKVRTIYVGGGTPNCLNDKQLEFLLTILTQINQDNLLEYTFELNPEHINKSQLQILKNYYVNRLSIGVQTTNDILLKAINRQHTVKDVVTSYELARNLGFKNISFDLIYNLPNQTSEDILNDIDFIAKLKPNHLSWYSLILKENSLWGKRKMRMPDHDADYDKLINLELYNLGYVRYEISNYYLTKSEPSLHNLSYWTNKAFFPLGPGACGFDNLHQKKYLLENNRNYNNWITNITQVSTYDYYFQILMMGLRLVEGINLLVVKDAKLAVSYFWQQIAQEIKKQNLILQNNYLKCSNDSFNYLNDILVNILS